MTNAFSKHVELPECRPRTWQRPVAMKTNTDVKGIYMDTMCYWNAVKNQQGVFKHLKLKRVCGSVAFNGWWEYGGAKYTLREFRERPQDSHCWLEDAEGNVYDYCQPSWDFYARSNGHAGKLPLGVEFRGVSKAALKAEGLTYKAAPANAQAFLLNWADESGVLMSMIIDECQWRPQAIREDLCGF